MKSIRIFFRAVQQFDADGATQMGAALAYYAIFSTAPLLILAIMVAGIIFGEDAARARVAEHLNELVGTASAHEITRLMQRVTRPADGSAAALVGGGLLLVGALGVFLHVRRCLCIIWRLEVPKNGLLLTLINCLLAIIMVLCTGILLLLSLAISTALPALADVIDENLPLGASFWNWVELGVSFVLLTLFFALVFRIMSARRIGWWYVLYGALICSLLFTVGKTVIALYLAYTSSASAYGAAGSLVAFLIWIYYSAQIFFFGAELVQARRTYGTQLPAVSVPKR